LLTLRRFFRDYKQLEKKAVEVEEIGPAKTAYAIIKDASKRYAKKYRRKRTV
jgi:inorganic pyrophosphatase